MRRLVRSIVIAAALFGSAGRARASEPPRTSSLGWVRLPGAESCIGARELARAVEERLGRTVFVSPAQAVALIEGRVEPAPAGPTSGGARFHVHLTVSDADGTVRGTRDLDAPAACRAIDEQLALVVALLIDPDAALAPKAPPPAPVARAASIAPVVEDRAFVPLPAPPPLPAPIPPVREPWRASLAVGPAGALGLLPGPGLALALRGELIPPRLFPFELGGAVWLDARATPAGASGSAAKGALVSLSYGMVGVCPLAWSSGGTRVRGCLDVAVGALRAVGYGFTHPAGAGQEQPVVQASVAGRVTQRLVGPLEIGVGLAVLVPLHRVRLFYLDADDHEQELFRMAAVAGMADAGIGLAFP
ncbi:Hypothetical protein A7982_03413 [Minicystis rosea]|nr:Hypothetical protein A7982_03413 [Minicystis rosea]